MPRGRSPPPAQWRTADDIEVRHRRREQERIDPVEHAAVARDERARLLRAGRALEHRLGEVAGLRRRRRATRPKHEAGEPRPPEGAERARAPTIAAATRPPTTPSTVFDGEMWA